MITTPGAAKWYCSDGAWPVNGCNSRLPTGLSLRRRAAQETICSDGAHAELETRIDLDGDSSFLGWEISCLGRTASGERFSKGRSAAVHGNSPAGSSSLGRVWTAGRKRSAARVPRRRRAGHTVTAPLAADSKVTEQLRDVCRLVPVPGGGTRSLRNHGFPGASGSRYLGGSSERARRYFTTLWRILRPGSQRREACLPRIWNTSR